VAKYQKLLTKFLKTNNIMEKMRHLEEANETQQGLTTQQIAELLKLEEAISNVKLEAESQVQHISAIPCSPRLLQAQKEVKYWGYTGDHGDWNSVTA
jgi:hypothetical protein